MIKRILIAIALLLVTAGVLLLIKMEWKDEPSPVQQPLVSTNSASSTKNGTRNFSSSRLGLIKRELEHLKVVRDVNDEWRTPIEFYGKVVDEKDNPVPGVLVSFGCNDTSLTGTSTYKSESNQNGLFSLRNVKGKLLVVSLSKEGYYSSKSNPPHFFYSGERVNFVPDPKNPVIFHLHKAGRYEPLIATDFPGFAKYAQLKRDGSPVEIDLIKGTIVPSGTGNLKLEFWADLGEKVRREFDWKCRLTVPGGGIVETDKEFAFEAPEDGYAPSVEILMNNLEASWESDARRKYFIHFPDGEFGRIDFYILANNGVYMIKSFINPSGSRNLEWNPAKAIPQRD
jgi:hypothetical protein